MKRHIYIYNDCAEITHPIVRGVQLLVADCVAGFIGDGFPGTLARAFAARELRAWRSKARLEARAVMLLDYLPESAVGARLRYYRAANKRASADYVNDRIDGATYRVRHAEILANVGAL